MLRYFILCILTFEFEALAYIRIPLYYIVKL